MKLLKLAIILSISTLFILACTQTDTNTAKTNTNKATNASPTATPTPDEMALGKIYYFEQCSKCHKEDGTGGKVEIEGKTLNVDNLTTEKMKKMPDEKYIKYMVDGIPEDGMPSFKDILKEDDMKAVVKYIRTEIQK